MSFSFINFFTRNLDSILIGKYFGMQSLGLYDRAYQLMRYPLQLVTFALVPAIQPNVVELESRSEVVKVHNWLIEILSFSTKLVLIGLILIPLLSSLPVAAFRISQIFLFFYPVMIASLYPLYSSFLYRTVFSLLVVVYGFGLCYAVVVSSKILNNYETIYEFSLY